MKIAIAFWLFMLAFFYFLAPAPAAYVHCGDGTTQDSVMKCYNPYTR